MSVLGPNLPDLGVERKERSPRYILHVLDVGCLSVGGSVAYCGALDNSQNCALEQAAGGFSIQVREASGLGLGKSQCWQGGRGKYMMEKSWWL